jgi:hypothetical protein
LCQPPVLALLCTKGFFSYRGSNLNVFLSAIDRAEGNISPAPFMEEEDLEEEDRR